MIRASVLLVALFALLLQGCSNGDDFQNDRRRVEEALNALATNLVENRPADVAAYTERLGRHVESDPSFFGSAVALIDEAGSVIASPYVYRTDEGYSTKDLASPSYGIESQEWFTAPIAADAGVWSEPYFDAGGGEIWMITRSVPVRDSEGIFAVVTTDLEVDAPSR
ncbi:MAG: hypothetical protein F4X40_02860 [Chloroflexi bacterium]|nr:hypothetical protein [Chloroflexota bacterium]